MLSCELYETLQKNSFLRLPSSMKHSRFEVAAFPVCTVLLFHTLLYCYDSHCWRGQVTGPCSQLPLNFCEPQIQKFTIASRQTFKNISICCYCCCYQTEYHSHRRHHNQYKRRISQSHFKMLKFHFDIKYELPYQGGFLQMKYRKQ